MKYTSKYGKKLRIKKGDEVIVLSGRSKGEIGKVDRIDKKKDRVYLAGKNLGKTHQKPDMQNTEGGIVDIPMPIHISSVALVDKNKKASRVGLRKDGERKVRFLKTTSTTVN